jgi:SHS2 domain-containing protein
MQPGFVILDHPADLGIEAHGRTLAEAFEQAGIALMSIILDLTTVEPKEFRKVQLKAMDPEQLLVKWLEELLYLYDGENFVSSKFVIKELGPNHLNASLEGEPFSETQHLTRLDVKAITYHQLSVQQSQEGGRVRVFLDI